MNSNTNKNLSASLEDYLEAIYNLSLENEVARSKDIAKLLGVAKPSVTGALKNLSLKKLVNYKPYGFVTLTEQGRLQAKAVAEKHAIIKSFFVDILGVDKTVAGKAACEIEHALGPQIMERLIGFVDFIGQNSKDGHDISKKFIEYCNNKGLNR